MKPTTEVYWFDSGNSSSRPNRNILIGRSYFFIPRNVVSLAPGTSRSAPGSAIVYSGSSCCCCCCCCSRAYTLQRLHGPPVAGTRWKSSRVGLCRQSSSSYTERTAIDEAASSSSSSLRWQCAMERAQRGYSVLPLANDEALGLSATSVMIGACSMIWFQCK